MSDNTGDSHPTAKPLAFGFSKKVKPNTFTLNNKLNNELKAEEVNDNKDTDFVLAIDGQQIQSTVQKQEKKELVIPLIVNNRYNLKSKNSDKSSINKSNNNNNNNNNNTEEISDNKSDVKVEETLEERAKKELLDEVKELTEDQSKSAIYSSLVIPVLDSLVQNRVPEGYETNDNFDVSIRPTEPTLGDYQSIPVEEFGLAMLRGMGWKTGMGIGVNAKEAYVPIEPVIRPKGLGLGANISIPKPVSKKSEDLKEDLQLKKGSFVCIEFGAHKGSYGVIEDFDDELTRVTVRLTLKKETIKTPIALIRVVSKKEFQDEGKVINKTHFDEYKQKEEKRDKQNGSENSKDSKGKHEIHSNVSQTSSHKRHHSSHHKSWLMPNLRVRIIDKKYKNAKYYKEKVKIIDVLSSDKCCCKTSDNRILDDIDCHMLETVIPRDSDSQVMIVEGKYRKQLATIVERHKSRNEADVQLLSDKRKVVTLSYDHICQYIH
ncbi:G-patch domain and KOW motifs-containing protein-like [Oppia nitens]|uniref:G-patch domain and KOW motifs-containing protein-like n=1 Tax=Oppia nitens TaxID=1686743 RepID=UPI0023DBFB5D|nr:G-patch domain and KOW motifs-containing protein-like [Oppia nitens]